MIIVLVHHGMSCALVGLKENSVQSWVNEMPLSRYQKLHRPSLNVPIGSNRSYGAIPR